MAIKCNERRLEEINALVTRLADRISPTREEREAEYSKASELIAALAKALPDAKISFVGSSARDTGLRGDRDIDIFVAWPRDVPRDAMIQRTFRAAKSAIDAKWQMHYAEHPYLKTVIEGYDVEIVPCYEIVSYEERISAVDRTILHMDYLQRRLSEEQRRDVRVLKAFLRAADIYGAEASIAGFSGIVCEYLILCYGGFAALIKAAKDWLPPVVIDVEGHWKGTRVDDVAARFGAKFVVVDVVDKNRNAAAAISEENFWKFVSLCQALWRNPSEALFEPVPGLSVEDALEVVRSSMTAREAAPFLVAAPKPDLLESILLPELAKSTRAIVKQLNSFGFCVLGSHYFINDGLYILLELEQPTLPRVERCIGPPISESEACTAFVKSHREILRGPFIEHNRLVVERPRLSTKARAFIERVARYPEMYGIAKDIQEPLRQASIYEGGDILSCKEAICGLAAYYTRRDKWLLL